MNSKHISTPSYSPPEETWPNSSMASSRGRTCPSVNPRASSTFICHWHGGLRKRNAVRKIYCLFWRAQDNCSLTSLSRAFILKGLQFWIFYFIFFTIQKCLISPPSFYLFTLHHLYANHNGAQLFLLLLSVIESNLFLVL